MKDKSEMDSTDKKRLRRMKKAKVRKNEKIKKTIEARVKKLNPGLGNKRAEQRSIEAIKQAVVNKEKIIQTSKVSVLPTHLILLKKLFCCVVDLEILGQN